MTGFVRSTLTVTDALYAFPAMRALVLPAPSRKMT